MAWKREGRGEGVDEMMRAPGITIWGLEVVWGHQATKIINTYWTGVGYTPEYDCRAELDVCGGISTWTHPRRPVKYHAVT